MHTPPLRWIRRRSPLRPHAGDRPDIADRPHTGVPPHTDDCPRTGVRPRIGLRLHTGLRWKFSASIALVGVLIAVALSLLVHNAVLVSMLDSSRDVQDERVQFAQRIYEATGRLQFGTVVDDPKLPRELRQKTAQGRRATYVSEGSSDDGPDIWAAVPLKGGHVLSRHTPFTAGSRGVMNDLDQALIIGSIAVVLGGSALGVLIGGQLSRRLRKAAAAAGEVARGQTDVRVRAAIGGVVRDETDDLARAVDAMADALRQRLEAERRVTADIAHELRTPVTGLVTAAELLPPGRPSELVKDRAQALRTLVEDVLEVARLDSAAERAELQDILLGEFVTRRVAALSPDTGVRVVRESEVTTDPRRLERILGNLLANAAQHGRPPVEVTVQGRMIQVRDHGPGFPAELLARGPSRFSTGSADRAGRGHGLGLTIAAGQTRVLGAQLTFRTLHPADTGDEGAQGDKGGDGSDGSDRSGGSLGDDRDGAAANAAGTVGTEGAAGSAGTAPADDQAKRVGAAEAAGALETVGGEVPTAGALAVLLLPEYAPTGTGSLPMIHQTDLPRREADA